MKDGERGLPIENYGTKELKEWLDNIVTVPDLHPYTAGNKEEEHTVPMVLKLLLIKEQSPLVGSISDKLKSREMPTQCEPHAYVFQLAMPMH